MAFEQNNISKTQRGTFHAPNWQGGIEIRTYHSNVDDYSLISNDGYFNEADGLQVGDIIFVRGTDNNSEILEVTTITPTTQTISVIGTASIPDGSITTAKLANSAVTDPKIASLTITGDKIATRTLVADKQAFYSPANTEPTVALVHYLDTTGGATGTQDKTFSGTGMVITKITMNFLTGGTTGDSLQIKDSGGNNITEIFNTEIPASAVREFTIVDQTYSTVNIGGFVRASWVDGGGNDSPQIRIGFHGYPVS